jgi:hypothetical protein
VPKDRVRVAIRRAPYRSIMGRTTTR